MSETFEVKSIFSNYTIRIEKEGINHFLEKKSGYVILDDKVRKLWPSLEVVSPITVEAKENHKTLQTVGDLIEQLRGNGANRMSILVAIGGGIIQDVSTFCASSYMRGVEWYYVPTTLLGMVDSCIGGKSSINVGQYKNIAGNFYPPNEILVDVEFCKTWTEQQLVEGLCEAVKICYAHSEERFLEYLKTIDLSKELRDQAFEDVVALSLKTKRQFIEEDELDQGIRLLLNFGHTFGHALEGASHFEISHGVAVGLGMLSAFHLSQSLGLLDEEPKKLGMLIEHVVLLLSEVDNLRQTVETLDMNEAFIKFQSDKKHSECQYVAILYDKNGSLIRHQFDKTPHNEQLVVDAFTRLRDLK